MDDRLSKLEAKVGELGEALERLERRLGDVERLRGPEAAAEDVSGELGAALAEVGETDEVNATAPVAGGTDAAPREDLMSWAAIAGRTLLILGGAYLLRALTEAGTLNASLGVPLAFLYAAIFLAVGFRAAGTGTKLNATGYGFAYVLITFPLLAESVTRFEYLSASQGAGALAAAAGLGLLVAHATRLRLLAWTMTVAAIVTATGSIIHTRETLPYLLFFIGLGILVDWSAARRGWLFLRVAGAAAMDLTAVLFGAVVLVLREQSAITVLVQLSPFVGYMGFCIVRSLRERRSFSVFERVQSIAVLIVGFLGAVLLSRDAPLEVGLMLGMASALLGVGGYATAYFMFVVPVRNPIDSWFNTTYPLVGVLAGSGLLLSEPAYAWAGISVLLTLLGMRDEHGALPVHGTVCALLAGIASGLVTQIGFAFGASSTTEWPALTVPFLVVLAVAALSYVAPLHGPSTRKLIATQAAKVISLALLVGGLGAVLMAGAVGPLAGGVGEGADAGRVAALRTAVLAISSLLIAALSRIERFREARFLIWPILAVGGLKLIAEDFPAGRPVTLFAAFALYGVALIVAPRLRWRHRDAT